MDGWNLRQEKHIGKNGQGNVFDTSRHCLQLRYSQALTAALHPTTSLKRVGEFPHRDSNVDSTFSYFDISMSDQKESKLRPSGMPQTTPCKANQSSKFHSFIVDWTISRIIFLLMSHWTNIIIYSQPFLRYFYSLFMSSCYPKVGQAFASPRFPVPMANQHFFHRHWSQPQF